MRIKRDDFHGSNLQGYFEGRQLSIESCSWSVSSEVIGNGGRGEQVKRREVVGYLKIVGSMDLRDVQGTLVLVGTNGEGRSAVCAMEGVVVVDQVFDLDTTDLSFVATTVHPWKPAGSSSPIDYYTEIQVPRAIQPELFTGADLTAWTVVGEDSWRVGNLESIVWETRWIEGEKQIVGSATFTQWDRQALIEAGWLDESGEPRDFSFVLVGTNPQGCQSMTVLEGVILESMVEGFSCNDLIQTVGVQFTCQSVLPWHRIEG